MGLLEKFGVKNPASDFIDRNRQAIIGLGTGFANGRGFSRGLGLAAQGLAQGSQADQVAIAADEAKAKKQAEISKTITYLRSNPAFADLAASVEAGGDVGAAFTEAWRRQNEASKPKEPIKASPGDIFLDPTTMQPTTTIPEAPPKPTSSMQEYDFAKSQGYTGTFQQYETDMKKAGATSIDFNQNQGQAAAYADRMATANAIISDPNIASVMTDLGKQGLSNVPLAGNFLVGPEFQQAEQAKRDFINAILRRESGATIQPSEFESASKQYFPQPGDGEEVLAQKADNRRVAIEGVQRAAGSNYQAPALVPSGVTTPQTTSTGVQWSIEP